MNSFDKKILEMIYKIRDILFGSKISRQLDSSALKGNISIFKEKYWDFLNWGYDKYTDWIIVPIECLERFCIWGWRCRWNYSFDASHSTYMLIYYNLKDMVDYSRQNGHLLWNSKENGKEFRRLKIACELAKRLGEDDYRQKTNEYNEKWGIDWQNEMIIFPNYDNNGKVLTYGTKWKSDKGLSREQLNQKRKEMNIAYDLDEQQKKNERKYLYKLLEKYGEGFWD